MVHIYANLNTKAMHARRREIVKAEIELLRKFEGRTLIEDRIAREMSKLHTLWFGPSPSTSKQ